MLLENFESAKRLMIGGQALVKLGSNRTTANTVYLVSMLGMPDFVHDKEANIDYCNASGQGIAGKFFAEVWKMEANNIGELASPQALLELKAFSFAQHYSNGRFRKADESEFDIKFLVREFGIKQIKIARKYLSAEELSEVEKVINSVRR